MHGQPHIRFRIVTRSMYLSVSYQEIRSYQNHKEISKNTKAKASIFLLPGHKFLPENMRLTIITQRMVIRGFVLLTYDYHKTSLDLGVEERSIRRHLAFVEPCKFPLHVLQCHCPRVGLGNLQQKYVNISIAQISVQCTSHYFTITYT